MSVCPPDNGGVLEGHQSKLTGHQSKLTGSPGVREGCARLAFPRRGAAGFCLGAAGFCLGRGAALLLGDAAAGGEVRRRKVVPAARPHKTVARPHFSFPSLERTWVVHGGLTGWTCLFVHIGGQQGGADSHLRLRPFRFIGY